MMDTRGIREKQVDNTEWFAKKEIKKGKKEI